jgi:hypothetical protein
MSWMTDESRFNSWWGAETYLFIIDIKPAPRPIKCPIQYVPVLLPQGMKWSGRETIYFHLIQGLPMTVAASSKA